MARGVPRHSGNLAGVGKCQVPRGLRERAFAELTASACRRTEMGRTARTRSAWMIGSVALLGGLAGCGLAVDLFNPAFLQGLGFSTPGSQQGTIIVNFNNQTNFPAVFNGLSGPIAAEPANGSFQFNTPVGPNASSNEVLSCPVRFLTLSELGDDEMLDNIAAVVTTADGDEAVAYQGTMLMSGRDFICGDVINVTLVPAMGGGDGGGDDDDGEDGEDQAFAVIVERIPGS